MTRSSGKTQKQIEFLANGLRQGLRVEVLADSIEREWEMYYRAIKHNDEFHSEDQDR